MSALTEALVADLAGASDEQRAQLAELLSLNPPMGGLFLSGRES
jgi:hypothetical protein